MSKRDELIAKYANDLREKCGAAVDMELLSRVTIGCGPTIYNSDASTVSATDPQELERVRKNFLIGKLGLADGPGLDAGIEAAIEQYGRSNTAKYRAVFYYLLVRHFGREAVYA